MNNLRRLALAHLILFSMILIFLFGPTRLLTAIFYNLLLRGITIFIISLVVLDFIIAFFGSDKWC